jgi:hypothetical protein
MQKRNMIRKQLVDRSITWLTSGYVDGREPPVILGLFIDICFHFIGQSYRLWQSNPPRQGLGFCELIALMAAGVIRASCLSYHCGGGVAPKPRHC